MSVRRATVWKVRVKEEESRVTGRGRWGKGDDGRVRGEGQGWGQGEACK